MDSWHFHNPVEIFFERGCTDQIQDYVGGKAVLITSPGTTARGTTEQIKKKLGPSLTVVFDRISPNPTLESVQAVHNELQKSSHDLIIAVGGGSTMDTAKAVATLGALGSLNTLAGIIKKGDAFPREFNPKPILAVPTTSGTGSEVTMWGTIWDMDKKKKFSISHPLLYPKTALLDPELSLSLPGDLTAYTGLDALSHAMEAIWNKNHNPVSDTLAIEAIRLVRTYLPLTRKTMNDLTLRGHMLRASLLAGLAFSNTKTAMAHSISYPLTAHFQIHHGLACALPLPHLLRFNGEKVPHRTGIMAESLGTQRSVHDMVSAVNRLFDELQISRNLSDYGIGHAEKKVILESAFTPGRAENNIVDIRQQDLKDIFARL